MPPENGMLQFYQQTIDTGFTSFVCNWKKFGILKLIEDNQAIDKQIKFQRVFYFIQVFTDRLSNPVPWRKDSFVS